MKPDRTIRRWHKAIIADAERILGRALTHTEAFFITRRAGCIALEMIHDNVKAGTPAEVARYLNSEARGPSSNASETSGPAPGVSLFPRVILRWREPKVLRVMAHEEARRSGMRMVSISIVAALPVIWLTHRLAADATGRVGMVLALVIGFTCFVLWVHRAFPSWVTVTENGIRQSVTTEDEQAWKFEAMRQCEIVTRHVGGRAVRVLVIETRQGDCSSVGVADSVSTEELEAALAAKSVKVIKTAEPAPALHVASLRR